ncbi:hypothetical protein [Nocardia sp. NPDC057668]|uniref:hypothetical protein n=1 Tax=Nocardia sp. NPDC057668 TaxID=3346202 RepID=UPI003671FA9A
MNEPPDWHAIDDAVRAAELRLDWDAAIAAVSSAAGCWSPDAGKHNAHLWHMDLLARAGRLDELAALGKTDVHARRRLERFLRENEREDAGANVPE